MRKISDWPNRNLFCCCVMVSIQMQDNFSIDTFLVDSFVSFANKQHFAHFGFSKFD